MRSAVASRRQSANEQRLVDRLIPWSVSFAKRVRRVSLRCNDLARRVECPRMPERSAGSGTAARLKLRQILGADLRSLALFRIALGVLTLWDLAVRIPMFRVLYGDGGDHKVRTAARLSRASSFSDCIMYL